MSLNALQMREADVHRDDSVLPNESTEAAPSVMETNKQDSELMIGSVQNDCHTSSDEGGDSDWDDQVGFVLVPSHKSKRRRRKPKKSPCVTAASAFAEATEPLRSVYIGKVNPKHSVKDIRDHLLTIGVNGNLAKVSLLADKAAYRSFRVEVPKSACDYILDRALWPSGVVIRPFRAPTKLKAAARSAENNFGGSWNGLKQSQWQDRTTRSQQSRWQDRSSRHQGQYRSGGVSQRSWDRYEPPRAQSWNYDYQQSDGPTESWPSHW